jgi:hypothetical protein
MKESHSQKAMSGYNAATGTSSAGFDKASTKYSGNMNQSGNPDALINKGRGPVVGNKSGKSTPGTDSMPALQCGKDMFKGSANPQVRTPGGTRAFDPSATKNYQGDANKINVGRGPTKGNQL